MPSPTAIVTGSAGLVGSAVVKRLIAEGFFVIGVDNHMRAKFFGPRYSTEVVTIELQRLPRDQYMHVHADLRLDYCYDALTAIVKERGGDDVTLIVHCASQPSHDWAATNPIVDFDINARATLLLLEWTRTYYSDAVFIYMSTNKVYGDFVNRLLYTELATRVRPVSEHISAYGIDESWPIDGSMHSLFGVSKTAGDLMTQEYGKYFGMRTLCLRCGCLTGGAHKGAKQHGFLAYLAKCVKQETPYTIIGHDGKQVRDNLHAEDVAQAIWQALGAMEERPRHGEAYNLGGGPERAVSVIEAIDALETLTHKRLHYDYEPLPRKGDHIWWITDTRLFSEWCAWTPTWSLEDILSELAES